MIGGDYGVPEPYTEAELQRRFDELSRLSTPLLARWIVGLHDLVERELLPTQLETDLLLACEVVSRREHAPREKLLPPHSGKRWTFGPLIRRF